MRIIKWERNVSSSKKPTMYLCYFILYYVWNQKNSYCPKSYNMVHGAVPRTLIRCSIGQFLFTIVVKCLKKKRRMASLLPNI